MRYYWENYYPCVRDDGRFLGYDEDLMIDDRFAKLRCGACHQRSPVYDTSMKYCPWCGKRMHKKQNAPIDIKPESLFRIREYAYTFDILELKEKFGGDK